MSFVIAGGAAVSIIGGLIGGGKAKRAKRAAAKKLKKMNAKMEDLEANRQEIINPYADSENLSSQMSNPMANLSVATQATEMQIEQNYWCLDLYNASYVWWWCWWWGWPDF